MPHHTADPELQTSKHERFNEPTVNDMRPNNPSQGQKRGRNRGPNNRRGGGGSHRSTFDSNGPNVRIRGSASQIHDKYVTLARDAMSAGDPVLAESYFQFAEHYYRIANPEETRPPRRHEDQGADASAAQPAAAPEEAETDAASGDRRRQANRHRNGDGRSDGRQESRTDGRTRNPRGERQESAEANSTGAAVETVGAIASGGEDGGQEDGANGRPALKAFNQADLPLDEGETAEAKPSAPAAKKAPAKRRRTPRAQAPVTPAELAAAASGDTAD